MISEAGKAKADVHLKDGDKIKFGKFELEARSTPGHTNGKWNADYACTDHELVTEF